MQMHNFSVYTKGGTKSVVLACYAVGALAVFTASPVLADCSSLPDYATLQEALMKSVKPTGGPSNGGLDLNMWATVVDRDGVVCVVTTSGKDRGDQWPGSRVISAQK